MADAEGCCGSGTETVAGKGTGCSAPDEEDGRCHAPNLSRTSRIGRTIRAQGWTVYEIPSTRSVGISIKHRPPFGARLAGAPPHIPMASLASVSFLLSTSESRPSSCIIEPPLRTSAPARPEASWQLEAEGPGPTATGCWARRHDGRRGRRGARTKLSQDASSSWVAIHPMPCRRCVASL